MAIPYYPNSSFWSTHPVFIGSLFTVIAIIAAVWICHKEARRKGLDLRMFYSSALWMAAGALLGGRITYFLLPGPGFLDVMNHGFHSIGVILGGFFGMLFYCIYERGTIKGRYKRMSFFLWNITDVWVLGAAIGTFFYRIGCFLSHCIEIGAPTNVPWAIIDYGVARHPINIYYSAAGILVFVLLVESSYKAGLSNKSKVNKPHLGKISAAFVIYYCLTRIILDFMRVEAKIFYLGVSSWFFILFITLVIIKRYYIDKKYKY